MPQAPRGRGDLEAGDGFLRRGDPVNLYPFIEAEKVGRRNVKRACALLKVSRAAFCQHLSGPSRRDQEDAEITEQIRAVHEESKGRYGAPRVQAGLRRRGDPAPDAVRSRQTLRVHAMSMRLTCGN